MRSVTEWTRLKYHTHSLVTCPSHPDDLDTQRRAPSGLPGASVPVIGLVSFADMQLDPTRWNRRSPRADRNSPEPLLPRQQEQWHPRRGEGMPSTLTP